MSSSYGRSGRSGKSPVERHALGRSLPHRLHADELVLLPPHALDELCVLAELSVQDHLGVCEQIFRSQSFFQGDPDLQAPIGERP
jgi:hypothetical protein